MAEHKRVSVKVDDAEIWALEAHYVVNRAANQTGLRIGDSMRARAYFFADVSVTDRNTPESVINLWKFSTETADPKHKVVITYYKDDEKAVLNTVKFTGWVSAFEYFNPSLGGAAGGATASTNLAGHNVVLYCELTVVLDDTNVSKHTFTK